MRTRLIILITLFVLILGAGGGGLYFLLRKGKQSQDLYQKAVVAHKQKDLDKAEQYLRRLLESSPDHALAFPHLMRILIETERLTEAEEAAKARTEAAPQLADGWNALIDIALARGDVATAERLARERAPVDPVRLQYTLWRILDQSTTPRGRLSAAAAAQRFAQVSPDLAQQASAEIYAAQTYAELSRIAQSPQREALSELAARLVQRIVTRLSEEIQTKPSTYLQLLISRAQLLSEDDAVANAAAQQLMEWIKANPGASNISNLRYGLVAHKLRLGEASLAAAIAKPIASGPAYTLYRLLQLFRSEKAYESALLLLEARPEEEMTDALLLSRADLLLSQSPPRPDLAAEIALKVGTQPGLSTSLVVQCYRLLDRAGKRAEALDLLLTAERDTENKSLKLLAASRLLSTDSREGEGLTRLEAFADEDDNRSAIGVVLRALGSAGPDAVLEFLGRRIEKGGANELYYRVARANFCSNIIAREGSTEEEQRKARALVRADLESVAESESVAGDVPWLAISAVSLRAREVAVSGRLWARALVRPEGSAAESVRAALLVASAPDAALRAEFHRGIEIEVADAAEFSWIRELGMRVRDGELSLDSMLSSLLKAGDVSDANERRAELIMLTAFDLDNRAVASAAAERLLELNPQDGPAAAVRGELLLREKKYAELVTYLEGLESLSARSNLQLVRALIQLENVEGAVSQANSYYQGDYRNAFTYLAMAEALIAAGKKQRALGVLTASPQTVLVAALRAAILVDLGRDGQAESIYLGILDQAPTHVSSWYRLHAILRKNRRQDEMMERLSAAIASPAALKSEPVMKALLLLRGMANDELGRATAAARDYVKAIELGERGALPLNNAAWVLFKEQPDKLETARQYIDWALEREPESPNINDTAAQIHSLSGDHVRALACIDVAIKGDPDQVNYKVTRARILAASGDLDAAEEQLTSIATLKPSVAVERKMDEVRADITKQREVRKNGAD